MAAVSAACLALPALPQFTLNKEGDTSGPPAQLKGKAAVDLIPGTRRGLGYPLRNDNVVPGTTEVFVNGRKLSTSEFSVDCTSGVLYVGADVKESDSIRVIYRHDPEATEIKNRVGALPLMTLNFGNSGSMTMLMGIGGAERTNGTVMQSNNLGFKNSFNLGKANVSGLLMRSSMDNARVEGDSASPDNNAVNEGKSSEGMLIKQNATIDVGNGISISADYQDIDESFTGFGMLASSGLDENSIKQLEKEKGITRMGFGLNGGSPKGIQFANSFRTIDDGTGKITFHNYGFKTGGVEAYYSSRDIDAGFSRFKDLSEKERDQYKKERGISREQFGGAFSMQGFKLSFSNNLISQNDAGIERRSIGFESNFLKASLKTQRIDEAFSRTGDLEEGEREQWGRERGMSREELNLSIPKGDKSLASFGMQDIEYDGRRFDAKSFGFNNGNYGVQFWNRSTDESFQRLGDLHRSELSAMALDVLSMYDPGAKVRDQDWQWVAREAGIARDFMKFDAKPFKNSAFSFSTIGIEASTGGVSRDVLDLTFGNYKFGYRKTNIDAGFNRMFDLLETERNLYGNQIGFNRSEWNASGKIDKKLEFSVDSLNISEAANGLDRFRASIKGSGFELQGAMRNVDAGFMRTGDVNDPERDLLSELRGFNEKDLTLKFDKIKGIKFNGLFFDADNGQEDQHRFRHEAGLLLNPDSKTEIEVSYRDHKFQGAKDMLFENTYSRLRGSRDLGKIGKLTLMHESEEFGGRDASQPSRDTNYLKYETKLGKHFDFMTEQGRTQFADGGYENYQGYKLGWQVTKRLGVNLEQVFVDRDADKVDNQSTNFGFSYDFGNNLKIGYTFREDMNSVVGGKQAFRWELSQGSFGGFNMGGSYSETGQAGQEDSFLGNFSLSNPKPFSFGFLKDIKLSIGYDGKNEIGVWKNEKRLGDISAKAFGSEVGFNYGQVLMPGAKIAAQRAITFKLDPSGKKPLQLAMAYKVRTMPGGEGYVIRDIDASYKLGDKLQISHSTDDLPEKEHGQAVFGTNLRPTLGRTWAIDYKASKSTSAKFGYEELSDISQHTLARRANLTLSFLESTGSPIRFTYTLDQNDRPVDGRRTRNEYKFSFEQKPGNNQTFSFMIGMVDWLDGLPEGELWNRVLLNLDYQLRF